MEQDPVEASDARTGLEGSRVGVGNTPGRIKIAQLALPAKVWISAVYFEPASSDAAEWFPQPYIETPAKGWPTDGTLVSGDRQEPQGVWGVCIPSGSMGECLMPAILRGPLPLLRLMPALGLVVQPAIRNP